MEILANVEYLHIRIMFVLFCFVCDHTLILLNYGAPHCAFGIVGKLFMTR
jgi:hypothetical protein